MNPCPHIRPRWGAPAAVAAAMSTRAGGVSRPPFDSLNLRPWVDGDAQQDEAHLLVENQARWAQCLGVSPAWLHQVHGVAVHEWTTAGLTLGAAVQRPTADAAFTQVRGLACTVLVADCLPVLMCDQGGTIVAAAHAGWRGLAAGVLERTVERLCERAGLKPADLMAWLGPCLGPEAFEVGPDVLSAMGCRVTPQDQPGFNWSPRPDHSPRWRMDLAGLAVQRLLGLGLPAQAVSVDGSCTFSEPSRFFSFRRDRLTGRMAASIWLR